MVPDRLFISGFRSYEIPTEIDINHRGIICITGHNGAGKSSILKAMLWALWAIGGRSVINRNSKSAAVEIDFTSGSDRFRVRRTMTANKHTLDIMKLEDDNKAVPLPFNGLKSGEAMLTEILGLDKESFIHSCFVGQNEADAFSKLQPKQRREVLSNMLGLWRFQELSEMAGKKRLSLEKKLAGLSVSLEQLKKSIEDPTPYTKELNKIQEEKRDSENKLENIYKMLDDVQKGFVKRAGLLSEQEAVKMRRDKLRSEWKKADKKLSELVTRKKKHKLLLAKKEKIKSKMSQYEAIKKKFDSLHTKRDKYLELKQKILGLKQYLSQQTEEAERKKAILLGRKESSKKRINSIEENLVRATEIKKRYRELLKLKDALEKSRAKAEHYARLGATVKNIKEIIAQEKTHIEDKIKMLGNELAAEKKLKKTENELDKQIAAEENKLASLREIADAELSVREERKKIEQDAAHIIAIIRQQEEIIAELNNKQELLAATNEPSCPLCGSPLDDKHREKIIADYDGKIKLAEATIEQNKKQSKIIAAKREKLDEKLKIIADAKRQTGETREHIAAMRSELIITRKRLAELANTGDELHKLKELIPSENYAVGKRQELSNTEKKIEKMNYTPGETESLKEAVIHLADAEREMNIVEKNEKELLIEKETVSKLDDKLRSINEKFVSGELPKIKNEITILEEKLNQLSFDEKAYVNAKKRYESLLDAPQDMAHLMSAESAMEEIIGRERELTNQQNELEKEGRKIAARLAELVDKLASLSKLDEKKRDLTNKQNKLRDRLKYLVPREGELKEKLASIKNIRKQIKNLKKEYNLVEHNTELHKMLEKAAGVNGVQAHILSMSIPFLENEANRLLGVLTGGDITLKMEADAHEKLSITIKRNNNHFAYVDLSGGERFRVDFALRIALSRLISRRAGHELSVLVVDEGFSSQDEEGITLVVEVLNAIAPEFERILVISHIESIKESFPAQISVRRDPEMGSLIETTDM